MCTPVVCIIPARMGSQRFPGKPLANIAGIPMILRVMSRAVAAGCFARIICATDSTLIKDRVEQAGMEAILTAPEHPTGTDRVAEVASLLHLPLVVNLQGDEPVVGLRILCDLTTSLRSRPEAWITASSTLHSSQRNSPNCVKVRTDSLGFAQEFIRTPVEENSGYFLHRGLYAYSLASLQEFASLAPSAAEQSLALEQLRILGRRPIQVIHDDNPGPAVDVPSDIDCVLQHLLSQSQKV